jgi:hypothetical protein
MTTKKKIEGAKGKAKPTKKAAPSQKNKGRGGAREGAGRKPKEITLLKAKIVKRHKDDADYAIRLLVTVMKDQWMPVEIRMDAAREVLDRVIGKPKQAVEHTGELPILVMDR